MSRQSGTKAKDLLTPRPALTERLLLAALGRNAHPLRPYPATAKAEELEEALADLRARGFVQGQRHEPNLTLAGRDAARALEEAALSAKPEKAAVA